MIKPNRVFKKKRYIKKGVTEEKQSRTRTEKEECSKTHENKTKKSNFEKTNKHAKTNKYDKYAQQKGK